MELKLKQQRIIINTIIMALWMCIVGIMYIDATMDAYLKVCILGAFIVYCLELILIYKNTKEVFHPIIIFLLAFYVFQNGQLLLLALDIPFYDFYINTLIQWLPQVALFSSISAVLAGYAGVIVSKCPVDKKRKIAYMDNYSDIAIEQASFLGMLVTSVVALVLIFIKFFGYSLNGGYENVRNFESTIPTIISFIEFMYAPFTILYLTFTRDKNSKIIVKLCFAIWAVLTALCGDRTTGIAALLVIVLIEYLLTEDEHLKKEKAIGVIVAGIACLVLINLTRMFRNGGSFDSSGEFKGLGIIGSFLNELGGSVFPMFTMMNIVPSEEPFLYGMEYVHSFISGLYPSSLDFFGIIEDLTPYSSIFNEYHFKYYSQYDFGLGFSLNAEAYINFGWFGLIAIFVLSCFIAHCLNNNYKLTYNGKRYGVYKTLVLLFMWFTLPRRSSYSMWNALFWCVFVMYIYITITCVPKNKMLK